MEDAFEQTPTHEPTSALPSPEDCLHRFNSQLPYKDRIPEENARLVAEITSALASFDPKLDEPHKILRACSGLRRLRDLKYNMDNESTLQVARALHSLAFPTAEVRPLPWRCQEKVLSALSQLIGRKASQLALVGRLQLPWRPMLAALDDCSQREYPLASTGNERSKRSSLLQLIREARRYWANGADREIWDEIKTDLADVQSQSAFRALFILCLFMPSRPGIYDELLPEWFRFWRQVDHCSAWDGGWLTLICRARKCASAEFDWTPYMPAIYSLARGSVHTPVSMGEAGSVPLQPARQVAYQYQALAPVASRRHGGIFIKLAAMLAFFVGKGGQRESVRLEDVAIVPSADLESASGGDLLAISPGAKHLVSLFRSLRTYFHPSNGGKWSGEVALLMFYVLHSLATRVGKESTLRETGRSLPSGELAREDVGLLVTTLLPLVLEMIYSKNASVGMISHSCLATLAALSPKAVAPAFARLCLRALDPIASINHTHQAPAAMRALTAAFRPLMYPRPYLAPYLPTLLELTLPGLDPNDVFKTTTTLELYHLILCWIPVQGNPVSYSDERLSEWTAPPRPWLDAATSSEEDDTLFSACEGLGGLLLEWSVALLDRIFEVLRHKDKSSKVKAGDLANDTMNVAGAMSGVGGGGLPGGRGMSLAAMLGGHGSESLLTGLMKLVTQQLFNMADQPAVDMASAKVLRFVMDRPLPYVEKDAAAIVEAIASAHPEKTVSAFFPALCDGLLVPATKGADDHAPALNPGASPTLLRWRLRLLGGLARGGRAAVAAHGRSLRRIIAAGIAHRDKGVRKCARKLLRKTLYGMCELVPAESRSLPPGRWDKVHSVIEWRRLCEPIPVGEHERTWAEPTAEGLMLASKLLEDFLAQPVQRLSSELERELAGGGDAAEASLWRENLKTMDYAIRGGVCLLSDRNAPVEGTDGAAYEHLRDDIYLAVGSDNLSRLLSAEDRAEGRRLYGKVAGLRAEVSSFMRAALDACASGHGPADVKAAKLAVRLSERIACTRGAHAHQARRRDLTLVAFKTQQGDTVAAKAGKMRLTLAIEAAADGDALAAATARRNLLETGLGGAAAYPRAVLIARESLQHLKRLAMAPRTLAFAAKHAASSAADASKGGDTPVGLVGSRSGIHVWSEAPAVLTRYRALYGALERLSYSEYAMVRATAQVGVQSVGAVHPWFTREIVPELIGRLSAGETAEGLEGRQEGDAVHRSFTGACYLLHQPRSMRYIASDWGCTKALMFALCDSQAVLARLPADKQEKAAARVAILFTSYISAWRANPISAPKAQAAYDAIMSGMLERLAAFKGAAQSTGGVWRYQLMASWCVMHLIRPDGACVPMDVWRWFTECLSEGDGQPLQRLALGALQRLLASFDPALSGSAEVSKLLCSRSFLRRFFLALAHNHVKQATEGGTAGAAQWSLGVKEILQDSGRGNTRELFPRLRFATRSRLFWARNARLVNAVISAVAEDDRAECINALLEEVTAQKGNAAHEDKRSFDCAAAEVAAGITAGLVRPGTWGKRQSVLVETALPFVTKELDGVSLEGRLDWTDAIRFALDRATLEASEPLVLKIIERTTALLQGGGKGRDDYSVLVKWLSFTGAVLIELSTRPHSASRAASIAKDLCPLLVDGLDHPFKACREEIARNLFLITNASATDWATHIADDVRESIVAEGTVVEEEPGRTSGNGEQEVANGIASLSVMDTAAEGGDDDEALLASALVMSDGAPTEEQEAEATRASKRLSLKRETVLQWLHQMVAGGDRVRYLPVLAALMPVALQSARDSSTEVATMGRATCLSSAASLIVQTPLSTEVAAGVYLDEAEAAVFDDVLRAVLSAASSESSWRVRRNSAAVSCVLQTRLNFVLTASQHDAVDATVLSLLGDTRREVQETALLALSTRVTHMTAGDTRILAERFAAGADTAAASRKKRRKLARQQPVGASAVPKEPSGAMKEQQVNVLGLSAIVLAAPCDVPRWVPGALESLSRHVNDESPGRLPVRQTVTHTFKEFRRTHQDKWEESHKARFTHDQLDCFDDVLGGAHSYFV